MALWYNPNLECRFNADELKKKHPDWDIQKKNKEWRELKKLDIKRAIKMYNDWLGIPWYKQIDVKKICRIVPYICIIFSILAIILLELIEKGDLNGYRKRAEKNR